MAIRINDIRGILFDIDGTISDSDDVFVQTISRFLHPLRGIFSTEQLDRFSRWVVMALETPGNFFYHSIDRLDLDALMIKFLGRKNKSKDSQSFEIIPGVRNTIIELKNHYQLGVVSARDEETTQYFLERFDLTKHFDVVVTSQTCRHTKPFPEPLLYASHQLGIKPERCLMVGDTPVDMRAGTAAKMQTIGVLCGFGTKKELERAGAQMVLGSTAQLADLLVPKP